MHAIENIDTTEQSVTATVCENAQLYSADPERGEFDPRDIWDADDALSAAGEAFRILAEGVGLDGTQLSDERESLLWGFVNTFDTQVRRLNRSVDRLAPELRDLQGAQDGSKVKSRELELVTDRAQNLGDRRDAFEQMRDAAGSGSWRIDETYVKVRGRWAYLYRAVDKFGDTIEFYLSATRNTKVAKRFLGKALKGCKDWELPEVLNTDEVPTYAAAIAELEAEGKCPKEMRHRQVKYLNNVVEAVHGKLEQLIRPVRGFKTMKTALRHDQGLRGHAGAAQGSGSGFLPPGWHHR